METTVLHSQPKAAAAAGTSSHAESAQQEELQARLAAVHEELRKIFKQSVESGYLNSNDMLEIEDDWLLSWRAHTQNMSVLDEYSKAMYELATKIWAPRNTTITSSSGTNQSKCRIEWVIGKVKQYFASILGSGKRLRLLDVGSCYNPFSSFQDILDIVAVDLCPAPQFRSVVHHADFLCIEILKSLNSPVRSILRIDGTSELTGLSSDYFDVVVFSFFLEYLPDTKQRLESCKRAWALLRTGGILFILRPDSNSVRPWSMKLIKELKVGLGVIGMKRLWCEKLQHLWAMGFLKLNPEEKLILIQSSNFQKDAQKLYFNNEVELHKLFASPQDFNKQRTQSLAASTDSSLADPLLFQELPGFD